MRRAGRTPGRRLLRRLLRHRSALTGALTLAALGLAVAAAPVVEFGLGHDAEAVDLLSRLAPVSAEHPLGTDELGRDLLLRLLHGGQVSLAIGLGGALLAALVGVVVGAVAGFAGGRTDAFLMRLTDAIMALPLLPVLIVLAAVDLGKLGVPADLATAPAAGIGRIVAIVALFGWTTVARLTRASVARLKRRDFVRAAEALGAALARLVHLPGRPRLQSAGRRPAGRPGAALRGPLRPAPVTSSCAVLPADRSDPNGHLLILR